MTPHSQPSTTAPWAPSFLYLFIPFVIGYFLSYVYRTTNAVLAPVLSGAFNLSAEQLGFLTGTYFLTFALCQIPLGIALDRFGAVRVSLCLLPFSALGALLHVVADGFVLLVLGRALIGIGVSSSLMAPLKAFSDRLNPKGLGIVNGAFMAIGSFGAVTSGAPLEALLHVISWQHIFLILGTISAGLVLLVATVIPPDRVPPKPPNPVRYRSIFVAPIYIVTVPVSTFVSTSFMAMQALWLGPWLDHHAGFDSSQVAMILTLLSLTTIAAHFVLGAATGHANRFALTPLGVLTICATLYTVAFACAVFLSPDLALYAWFVVAFLAPSGILIFAIFPHTLAPQLIGRANTFQNALVFFSIFAVQWAMGAVIDLGRSEGVMSEATAFTLALMLLCVPLTLSLAVLIGGSLICNLPLRAPMQPAQSARPTKHQP